MDVRSISGDEDSSKSDKISREGLETWLVLTLYFAKVRRVRRSCACELAAGALVGVWGVGLGFGLEVDFGAGTATPCSLCCDAQRPKSRNSEKDFCESGKGCDCGSFHCGWGSFHCGCGSFHCGVGEGGAGAGEGGEGVGVAGSVGDPGSARAEGLLDFRVSTGRTYCLGEMYCVALYRGCSELCDGVLLFLGSITLECDHLRGGDALRVVHVGDAPLSSMRERVDTCGVLFVCEGSRSGSGLLQWALRSSEFGRLHIFGFRGRVHCLGWQFA